MKTNGSLSRKAKFRLEQANARFLVSCFVYCSVFFLSIGVALGQIYKCKGKSGNTIYSENPCTDRAVGAADERGKRKQPISESLKEMGFTPMPANELPNPAADIIARLLSGVRARAAAGLPLAAKSASDTEIPSADRRAELAHLAAENNSIVVIYDRKKVRLAAAFPIKCHRNPACVGFPIPEIEASSWCAITLFVGGDTWGRKDDQPSWEEYVSCNNGVHKEIFPTEGIPDAANLDHDKWDAEKKGGRTDRPEPVPAAPQYYYPAKRR